MRGPSRSIAKNAIRGGRCCEILDTLVANHLAEAGKTTEAIEAIRVTLIAANAYLNWLNSRSTMIERGI